MVPTGAYRTTIADSSALKVYFSGARVDIHRAGCQDTSEVAGLTSNEQIATVGIERGLFQEHTDLPKIGRIARAGDGGAGHSVTITHRQTMPRCA